jgi:hypothetical protein
MVLADDLAAKALPLVLFAAAIILLTDSTK